MSTCTVRYMLMLLSFPSASLGSLIHTIPDCACLFPKVTTPTVCANIAACTMESGPTCPPCEVTVFQDENVRTCSSCLQTSNSIDRDSEDMIRWAKSRKHKTLKEMVLEGNECYKCWETRVESFGGMQLAKLLAARLNSEDCLQLSSRGCVHVKYSKLRLHFMILILAVPLVFSLACCAVSHGVWSYNSHLFVIPCRYLQDLQQSSLRYLLMFALNLLSALVLAVPTSSKLMGWFSESTQLSKPVCRKATTSKTGCSTECRVDLIVLERSRNTFPPRQPRSSAMINTMFGRWPKFCSAIESSALANADEAAANQMKKRS